MIFHAFNFLVFIWPSSFEPMGRIFFSVVILNMLHVQVNIFCEFLFSRSLLSKLFLLLTITDNLEILAFFSLFYWCPLELLHCVWSCCCLQLVTGLPSLCSFCRISAIGYQSSGVYRQLIAITCVLLFSA